MYGRKRLYRKIKMKSSKKHLVLFFFFMMFSGYVANSQVLIALLLGDVLNTGKIEFGLDGGLNYSDITGLEANKKLRNFNLGFYFDILLKDQWFLNTGVLVKSNMGIRNLTDDDLKRLNATIYDGYEGDYKQVMKTFLIPALIKYKFKKHYYLEAGPEFNLVYKGWIEFNSKYEGNSAQFKENNRDAMNRFDVGVGIGAGYRLLDGYGWTLGIRYYYGFIDLYKDISGTKNNGLYLKLNIPIGVSEETKKIVSEKKAQLNEKKAQRKAAKKAKKASKKEN